MEDDSIFNVWAGDGSGAMHIDPTRAPSRNMAIVRMSDAFLINMLQSGTRAARVVKNALPDDARIVDVYFDGREIAFKIEGSGLPEVKQGEFIPSVDIRFEAIRSEADR